ncbi:hypothetical protein LJB87_02560, partial [Alistipes sp. OttesenSCG-928-L06]|nr:hypothetical protein [Alistipes sp. OttesenSCG-928-L06]
MKTGIVKIFFKKISHKRSTTLKISTLLIEKNHSFFDIIQARAPAKGQQVSPPTRVGNRFATHVFWTMVRYMFALP